MKNIIIATAVAAVFSGCVVEPARVYVAQPYRPVQAEIVYQAPAPQPVVSINVEPPLVQPAPVLVGWAPPPMLVEAPPPVPFPGAIWTGGYWVWEGNWVWAHGHWAGPPQPGYGWVNPYYENRGGGVVFVNGFWAAPGVTFVAPPVGISITVGIVAAGVIAGPRCNGPEGVFVPSPPGSHFGLIVPAPVGTAPAVVTSAPPIINQGMHITTINNVQNITNVTNVTNVTIVAPPTATASGQAVNSSVPTQPHLAAAMTPVVHAAAPQPASTKTFPAYVAGHPPAALPPAQVVHAVVPPALTQPHQVAPQQDPQSTPPAATQPASHIAPTPANQENHNQANEPRSPQGEPKPQSVQAKPQVEPVPQPQRPQEHEHANVKPVEMPAVAKPRTEPHPAHPKEPAEVKQKKSKEEEEKEAHERHER